MPRLRVRWTVRGLIVAVAVLALGLAVAQEFGDGLPPRFVLRGIPGRVSQLRPGMSREQTFEILGVGRSWLRGGTGARFQFAFGSGGYSYESLVVRQGRAVVRKPRQGERSGTRIVQSSAWIHLRFRFEPGALPFGSQRDSRRLESASFAIDGRTVAEMPDPRRTRRVRAPGRGSVRDGASRGPFPAGTIGSSAWASPIRGAMPTPAGACP